MSLRHNLSGLDAFENKDSNPTKDFLEDYFKRKQSNDYLECGNCPLWHPCGHSYTCHGTFVTGRCEMIDDTLFNDCHECKLSAEERRDFMAKKGGDLPEPSKKQKDSVEDRLDKIEERLRKLEEDAITVLASDVINQIKQIKNE